MSQVHVVNFTKQDDRGSGILKAFTRREAAVQLVEKLNAASKKMWSSEIPFAALVANYNEVFPWDWEFCCGSRLQFHVDTIKLASPRVRKVKTV